MSTPALNSDTESSSMNTGRKRGQPHDIADGDRPRKCRKSNAVPSSTVITSDEAFRRISKWVNSLKSIFHIDYK